MTHHNDSSHVGVDLRSSAPLIEARRITRRDAQRGQVLLQPTNFALHAGQRVVLTGPSGSGKSVFLRALALLDPLDGGMLHWHGQPIASARIPHYRRHIAYVRQRPALIDGTVEDNLRYPFSLAAYRDAAFDAARVRALFDAAGRGTGFLARETSELSGGEAQIVALVRVLQLDPEALLLDEPTASLDPESAREVETLITQWFEHERAARATVWVSHDPAQAQRVGERHITMRAGALDEPAATHATMGALR
ncbi:putative iron export ATP-binding protein FetA [Paraburkholderia caffeinitolerans]|uniref:Putative iron export ATP-binding protein FetA n=1 Tax=Paraburkholderia caffeinitolerans TaxID=1723730 RepID=A0A6J5G887_9BURK|nr:MULTISPECIES: ATP-binding cassette domain-containing protein [Paraburkholderia]CAB3795279.1 putative iron export ATP-binding protein FetA [Paraburkholderia caffeinitolerans]